MQLKILHGGRAQLVSEALEAFKQNDTSSFIHKFSRLSSIAHNKGRLSVVKTKQSEDNQ